VAFFDLGYALVLLTVKSSKAAQQQEDSLIKAGFKDYLTRLP
jgi:hypothetical protein